MTSKKLINYLKDFNYSRPTKVDHINIGGKNYNKFTNEFWTSKQRQGNNLHEIAYRACFKAELPRFFIEILTDPKDTIYDPFSGRGTTAIEGAILGRNIISNDINPISKILSQPRIYIPKIEEIEKRLYSIPFEKDIEEEVDLSAFFHPKTQIEIFSIKKYLEGNRANGEEDIIDKWIRMVATNRLTGHSSGYFSVYTLPPNQATSIKRQEKINQKRNQKPEYRDTRKIILKKVRALLNGIDEEIEKNLSNIRDEALFLEEDSRMTKEIKDESVQLVVTSPPFLDIVQYADDNWLRCWFNSIDTEEISKKITMCKKLEDWKGVMKETLRELHRVVKKGGYIAFEVGEVRNGKIRLDEEIIPLGEEIGFNCLGIMINEQNFTKTSNIWGISNNKRGTNSNRIVIFNK